MQMLFSILRSTEPYLDVYFSEAAGLDNELYEAGFSTVSLLLPFMADSSTTVIALGPYMLL